MKYVVITLASGCGSKFEADIAYTHGFGHMSSTACPDCGESMNIPDPLVSSLIRLEYKIPPGRPLS